MNVGFILVENLVFQFWEHHTLKYIEEVNSLWSYFATHKPHKTFENFWTNVFKFSWNKAVRFVLDSKKLN